MSVRSVLLVVATLVLGLSAGFFVTYQISVMPGLSLVDDLTFVRTMQSMNATVRSLPFAVIFFGPLPLLVIAALVHVRRPAVAVLIGAAAVVYAGGVLGVTFAGNVPLNEALALREDPADRPRLGRLSRSHG